MTVRLAVADLIAATGGQVVLPPGEALPDTVSGVVTDSRLAGPGDLFVALRGPRTDGHRFVADAAARGAALSLVSDAAAACGPAVVVADSVRALGAIAALHRRTLDTTVVGITGSVGKTTTVALCAAVLATRYAVARSAESWNAELGVALTLLGLDRSHEVAVIEMAMRGLGQIRELVEMARPRIGAVTNIGDSHLELLGSHANIAAAKAELLEGLPPDGVAIVSADEPWMPRLVRDARCRVVRVGFSPEADLRATGVVRADGGWRFLLDNGGRRAHVSLPLAGSHQVRNALLAAAVGMVLGLTLDEVAAALARARPTKMRQELLVLGDILVIDDAYNASPQSMEAAFEVVAQVGGSRRRVLALGEMRELGPTAPALHRRVGAQAAALGPAFLLAVGPDARWLLEGAIAAGLPPASAGLAETTQDAIPLLRRIVQPGDVVLIKGSRAVEMEHLVEALRSGDAVARP